MIDVVLSNLVKLSGKTQKQIAADLSLSQQRFNYYVTGKREPDSETLKALSAYFGVTTDYLLGIEDTKKSPTLTEKDERDIAKDVERIMSNLETSGNLMFDGVPMSQEAKDSMAAAMKLGLEAARLKNKKTYTPKKYKKE